MAFALSRATFDVLENMADTDCLNGLPDALIIKGEAYAAKLLQAGVDVTAVRIKAAIHDFVMLNALDQTNACRTAMDLSTAWINRKNLC